LAELEREDAVVASTMDLLDWPQPNSPTGSAPNSIQELGLLSGLQPVAVDQATSHDDEAGCWILGGMDLAAPGGDGLASSMPGACCPRKGRVA